jgi:ssDNA-binding Zn-finger/Zn-ribbon topoisomerase 1
VEQMKCPFCQTDMVLAREENDKPALYHLISSGFQKEGYCLNIEKGAILSVHLCPKCHFIALFNAKMRGEV